MSKKSKLLAKLANFQADNSWTVDEVVLLLTQNGWVKTGGKSSHQVFSHPEYAHTLGFAAHGNKIKGGYIREIRFAFQELETQKKKATE